MKNKQICPYCGKTLDDMYQDSRIGTRKISEDALYRIYMSGNMVGSCRKCHQLLYDSNRRLWNVLYGNGIGISIVLTLFMILIYFAVNPKPYILAIIWLVIILIIGLIYKILFSILVNQRNSFRQHYIAVRNEKNIHQVIFKSTFSVQVSFSASLPVKQLKKEFVKDNILQISANGESEYIILTKADFETGKCEATFPAMKKENGLALLEKYSEFELSNGEEVLGTLKITGRYEE